ncbi:MAG: 23S rRNA (guanosine(2251)-2'-O)-methyltransferase RlmB [Firmicutes bacterium]|nr:23S rRNA (guanosine(2251)-2'-O)-methyltransferase RlmB [Bacillota bacterium]
MKIEGKNAVAEAIKSGATIDRLIVQKGLSDHSSNAIINDAKNKGIKIFFRDKEALDRESPNGRHQGFVADVTDFGYSEVSNILKSESSATPLIFILDGIEDPHNLGSILRVAECSGASGVVIPRHRSVSVTETVVKVSAGAAAHVKVAKVTNVNDAIDECKAAGVWVYALDADGDNIFEADLSNRSIAFVVGGEGKGVTPLTRKKCDGVLSIPMYGKVGSLNASVAAGVAAFAARAAGGKKSGGNSKNKGKQFRDIFAEARSKAGLSLTDVAELTKVKINMLIRYDAGERMPTYKAYLKLTDILGISEEEFAMSRLEFDRRKAEKKS